MSLARMSALKIQLEGEARRTRNAASGNLSRNGTRKISSPPRRGLSWAKATGPSARTASDAVSSAARRGRGRMVLLRQPDRVELTVQEVARGDRPAAHPGVVRHDPVPPQRRDHVHLLVEQALLELADDLAPLVDVARPGLTVVEGVERAVREPPVAGVGAVGGEELVEVEVGLDDVTTLAVQAHLEIAGAQRVEPRGALQHAHGGVEPDLLPLIHEPDAQRLVRLRQVAIVEHERKAVGHARLA